MGKKTLWENEKMMVTSIFSFSHNVFNPFPNKSGLQYKPSENTLGKGEIAHNEQFLLFHRVFYLFGELSAIFVEFEKLSSANSFSLEDV